VEDQLRDKLMTVDFAWLYGTFPSLSKWEPLQPGGQKWVFRCEHQETGPCVLKIIKPGAAQRLDRELEAVRRLEQLSLRNVPHVYQVGTIDSQVGPLIWLLEQYVDGTDLSEMLRQGPLNRNEVLNLALDLVSVAKEGESVNVVHRDIKPRNIKIDPDGEAWLLDFGIVRILDLESKTRSDAVVGPHSPGYSAPEQFRYQKRAIDGRSDLFAIGVVLYESAMGVNPFIEGARDSREVLRRVENDPLPRLELEWDGGRLFSDFVSTLTQKYPYQRPRTCAEALHWLEEIMVQLRGL
jgi:serine/threonine protein kinase